MGVNSLKLARKAEIRPLEDTECLSRWHYTFLKRGNLMTAKLIISNSTEMVTLRTFSYTRQGLLRRQL